MNKGAGKLPDGFYEGDLDPRFVISNREAVYSLLLTLGYFLWWFGFAYGFGEKAVSDYFYVFGLPAWFFYSCLVGGGLFCMVVPIVVLCFFEDMPLDDGKGEGGRETFSCGT